MAGKGFFKKAQRFGRAFNRVVIDGEKTFSKAGQDTINTAAKALKDTVVAEEQARHDLGHGFVTAGKFVERQANGISDMFADAEKRLREGKPGDAVWHFGTDPFKHTERNAAKAFQESNILRTVGQVAASAYGGPGGAAAFSTWYAYRTTGDVKTALRAGAVTGATSLAFAQVAAMPAETGDQVAGKAVTAAVVGGAAMVANGGKATDVRDGMLLGAATSLAQTAYEKTTDHPIDGRSSTGDAYCKASPRVACAPLDNAYVRGRDGKIVMDGKTPRLDITKTDPSVPQVGKFDTADGIGLLGERSGFMTGVSRVPGMNAMGYFHDTWSSNWRMPDGINEITIAPATIMTYTGTGAPMIDRIQNVATKEKQREVTN